MDDVMPEEYLPLAGEPPQIFNVAELTPQEHRHDRIIGNQLMCTLHNGCGVSMTIKPTEVLEYDAKGVLQLVDKAP